MATSLAFNFETYLHTRRDLVEKQLTTYLKGSEPAELWESMRYSVLSGGKRIRAVLCIAAAEACRSFLANSPAEEIERSPLYELQAGLLERVMPCACAIELIHAMSLIHDDLPCMDDDDFRRGKASNHKVFGEAMALLAGDALLVLALEQVLKETSRQVDRKNLIEVASRLAGASGANGMVGGQVLDIRAEKERAATSKEAGVKLLNEIHERKTGALLQFSVWSGACLAGAPDSVLSDFMEFGRILGLSFQIADDLLDVTGSKSTLGKTPGKDEAAGKLTWVSLYGIETAKEKLRELEEEGKTILAKNEIIERQNLLPLESLLEYSIHRIH